MKRIAKFEKVSFEQYREDWLKEAPGTEEEKDPEIYEQIRLPKRATSGSAGYDFYAPCGISLKPGETVKVLTESGRGSTRDGCLPFIREAALVFGTACS